MTTAELLQRKAQLLLQCAEADPAKRGEFKAFADAYLQRASELINLPGPGENHEAISERVKHQLRDRHGRWIKMHSEVTVHSPLSGQTFTGKVTSIDPVNNQVHVKLDGVTASVPEDPKNIEAVQAVLHHDNGVTQTLAEHVAAGTPNAKPYTFIQHSQHTQSDGSVIHRVSAKDTNGKTYSQMEFDHTGKAVHAAGAQGPEGQKTFAELRSHAENNIFTPSAGGELYTSDELNAIKDYTYDSNSGINEYLRGFTESISEENQQTLDQLNNAIQKDKLDGDMTLWRAAGAGSVPDETLKPGTEITDKAFISTTSDKVIASGHHSEFDNSVVFEIHAPAGTPAIDVEKTFNQHPDDTEGEFILNRGTTFRVISDSGLPEDDIDGQRYIKVEVVNHGDTSQWKHQSEAQLEEGGHSDHATASSESHAAEDKLDVSGWQKVGGQAGSNPGGTFEDPAGERWYIKEAQTPDHAKNEALASAFYRDLGINVPEVQVATKDGKTVIASKLVPGGTSDLKSKLNNAAYKKKLQEGFVADSWLANWDVAGLVYDNVVTGQDGQPWRIDTGGSLLFRAMGTPKGNLFGDTVGEVETLRDPSMNPTSANVFSGMHHDEIKAQVQHLVDSMPNQKIANLVHNQGFDNSTSDKLISTLVSRRDYLANKYGVTSASVKNDAPLEATPAVLAIKDGVFADTLQPGDHYFGIANYGPTGGIPSGGIYKVDNVDKFGGGIIALTVTDQHGIQDTIEINNDTVMWKAASDAQPWDPAVATGNDNAPGLSTAPPDNEPFQLGWSNEKIQIGHQVKSMTDGKTGTVVKLESNGLYVKVKMDQDGKIKGRKSSTLKRLTPPKPTPTPEPQQPAPAVPNVQEAPIPSLPAKSELPMDIASVRHRVDQALIDGENHGVTSHDLNPHDLLDDLYNDTGDFITVKPPGGYETSLRRADVEALVKDAGLVPPANTPTPASPASPPQTPSVEKAEIGDVVKVGPYIEGTVEKVANGGVYFKSPLGGAALYAEHGGYEVKTKSAAVPQTPAPTPPAGNTGLPPYVQQSMIKPGDSFYKNSDNAIMALHTDGTAHIFHQDGVVGQTSTANKKYLDSDKNKHWIPLFPGQSESGAGGPTTATETMKDMYGKDLKPGDWAEVETYDEEDGSPSWSQGPVVSISNGKATVEADGETLKDLPSEQVKLINSADNNTHPNEPPQLVEPPKTETYTPKPGEKSIPGNGSVPIYKGSQVMSLNDGFVGTVTALESNGQYVKVRGHDGKIKGRKASTLEVVAHPNGQKPNHATALNSTSITDTGGSTQAVPAELQKYVGQPAPKMPAEATVSKGPYVGNDWLQKVKDRYTSFSPGKLLENSNNWNRVQSVMNSGDIDALNKLLSGKYVDQALFDEAKAKIDTLNKENADALAKHQADVKAWQHELMLWNKANGVKGGIFDPENFALQGMDGARDWPSTAAGTAWAKKTWPGANSYSSSQLGALQSYASSSSGFNGSLWKMKEASNDPSKISQSVKNLDAAMNAAPRVPEDIIVRRGNGVDEFVDLGGVRFQNYGNPDLTQIKGTIQANWGFTSTSVATKAAFSEHKVQMKIRVPKGFKAVYMHANGISGHSEYELLLSRGGHFFIHDIKMVGGKWEVDAELVPEGWPEDKSIPVLAGARFT